MITRSNVVSLGVEALSMDVVPFTYFSATRACDALITRDATTAPSGRHGSG
jgi:hypothetical protein